MVKKISLLFLTVAALLSALALCGCSKRSEAVKISFVTNGGSTVEERENTVDSFPVSTREGFAIEGWYTDPSFENMVKFPFSATKSTSLYANWTDLREGSVGIVYERTEDGRGLIAKSYSRHSYSVCVPDTSAGLPVVEISAFFLKSSLYVNRFYIGKNVTEIKEHFYRFSALSRIILIGENSRYSIEKQGVLFDKKSGEIYALPRNGGVTELTFDCALSKNAIRDNTSLKTLRLGKSATVSDGAFYGLTALESFEVASENPHYRAENGALYSADGGVLYRVPPRRDGAFEISDATERVAQGAFEGSGVREIRIGASLVKFGDFSASPELIEFTLDKRNTSFMTENGALYSADGGVLVRVPCAKSGDFAVKNGTRTVGTLAFADCAVERVTLPKSVATVGLKAFSDCKNLTEVTFEEDSEAEKIDGGAFTGCVALEKITLTSRRPPTTDEYLFSATEKKELTVLVPRNTLEIYRHFWSFCYAALKPSALSVAVYSVEFDTCGADPIPTFFGTLLKTEPFPVMENRVFLGWFDNEGMLGNRVEFPLIVEKDITLYAFWGYSE